MLMKQGSQRTHRNHDEHKVLIRNRNFFVSVVYIVSFVFLITFEATSLFYQLPCFAIFLTVVVAPPFKVRSTGLFVFHAPLVKSGTSTLLDLAATDFWLK